MTTINTQHENLDFLVWLGDNLAHDVYDQTIEGHKKVLAILTNKLLLNHKGIGKMYPVLGNHEGLPCDHVDVGSKGPHWLFEYVAELWSPWLTKESQQSLKLYGRYAQLHPGTNLRIIALNSFVQDAMNSHTWVNSTDLMGELIWLKETLENCEKAREQALIISHFPPYNTFANKGFFLLKFNRMEQEIFSSCG